MAILLTILLTVLSTNAYTADTLKFYIGAEKQAATLSFSDGAIETNNGSFNLYSKDYYADKYSSFTPVLGYQINEHSAIEVSYFKDSAQYANNSTGLLWTSGIKNGQAITVITNTNIKMYNIDTVHNLKIDKAPVRLLGILGASIIDIEAQELYNNDASSTSEVRGFGINIGVGVEIELHKHVSLITKAKYTQALNTDFEGLYATKGLDNITTLSTGIKIKF